MEETILIELYKEQMAYCRHNEAQRSIMTNLILVISAVILGLIFHEGKLLDNLHFSYLLTILGIFGIFFSQKHYERWRLHDSLSDEYRKLLELKYPTVIVDRQPVFSKLREEHRIIHVIPLNFLWTAIPFIITLIGISTIILAWFP